MDPLELCIKEAPDGLQESSVPGELWPMVVAALVEGRYGGYLDTLPSE